MTTQDKIDSIIAAIQTDTAVIALMRALLTKNLPIMQDFQLDNIRTALGLS